MLYAVYADCDPITAKTVRKQVGFKIQNLQASQFLSNLYVQDQLVPFMVLDIAGTVPGLPGLFMAGVFSGSLRYQDFQRQNGFSFEPNNL